MKYHILAVLLLVGLSQAELPTEIPDLDDFEVIKERCDKKGGAGTYEKVKAAGEQTQKCVKDIIDVERIKTEVEEAKKTGSMDEVFGKYCGKRPQIKECVKKVYDAVQPCLEDSEKNALNVTGNIVTQISDFACYRDGDRIAMFVAEGGVECLSSRTESIKNCVNQTLKFNPATFSPNSITNLTIDKKKCDDLSSIQDCIVKDLEDHCSSTTPANVIDAVFRFVKKTACKDSKPKRSISLRRATRSVTKLANDKFKNLQDKLKATCEKNGGEGTYEQFMAAYNNSQSCFTKYKIFLTPYNVYKSSLRNCTIDTRNTLKNCLKEEEKYYPDFILEVLQALFEFVYRNVNNFMVRGQPNAELASCMKALSKDEAQTQIISCINATSIQSADSRFITIPPKSELCQRLNEGVNCISGTVKNTCIQDITITKLVDDYIASVTAPCANINTA